jgi:hydrogenase small subunit
MSRTLYWLQAGACGGDTWSLLNLESPDLVELTELLGLEVLYHPSLSNLSPGEHARLVDDLATGTVPLDFLCVEGSILQGPGGTGLYDALGGRPKKDLLTRLAARAGHVIAVGTCASFGGLSADGESHGTGLQFHKGEKGGFLGADFLSRAGAPVINLPGCPTHCEVISSALSALSTGQPPQLNELNAPLEHYGLLVHQGCMRNEYHEYRVEEREFGERGCLFFHRGCRGPLAYGPCNKLLWNRRSSKTRAGVPCVGCTEPTFPRSEPFFTTRALAEIPLELPDGIDRAHYLAYKGMAAAAAPERLKKRKTLV